MADLTKQHLCETSSESDFSASQLRRATLLQLSNPQNVTSKNILREKTNLNSLRDRIEKQLRFVSKLTPDASNEEGRFSAVNQEKIRQDMRAMLAETKRMEDYLTIAESHGFGTAEQVEKNSVSGGLEDSTAKVLADVLKSKGSASRVASSPPQFNPYGYPPAFQPPRPAGSFNDQGWPYYQMQPQKPPTFRPPYPGAKKPRMAAPNKESSLCYSCNMIGHWSGDPECPLVNLNQPPPPGTGSN